MKLKTCLGCFSLRTGTIAVGVLSIVWSILSAISAVPHCGAIEENVTENAQPFVKMVFTGLLTYIIIIGVMAVFMIVGAHKRNPDYVFPWLAIATTELLAFTSISFGFVVTSPTIFPIEWFFAILAIFSVAVCVHLYVWLVVYSFYKELIHEKYSVAAPPYEDKISNQPMNVYHNV